MLLPIKCIILLSGFITIVNSIITNEDNKGATTTAVPKTDPETETTSAAILADSNKDNNVESRQARFFPSDNDQTAYNQNYLSSSQYPPQTPSNYLNPNAREEVFKFSDENRQNFQNPAAQQTFNSGEVYVGNPNPNQIYPRPAQPSPQIVRRPPPNNYAQNHQQYQKPYHPNAIPNQYYQTRPPPYQFGHQQQNYAGGFENYQDQSDQNPISNFISNLGQGAAELFSGGQSSQSYNGPNGYFDNSGRPPPQFSGAGRPPPGLNGEPGATVPFGPLGKAIEEITRNDDFQCIPKVICQMVGNQRTQNTLLGSPIFSSLISAVPSTSSGLVYGRAALLGYTAGERSCNGAYPKCPKNEDDLLYYLNNHRGGFFRFFNSGAAFGDDSHHNYNQNSQNYNQNSQNYNQNSQNYNQQSVAQNPQAALGNLAVLQGLAEAINQNGGINLSNLGANSGLLGNLAGILGGGNGGGASQLSSLLGGGNGVASQLAGLGGFGQNTVASQNEGIGLGSVSDYFGNLLTGFVGNRFSSRRISKRSVEEDTNNSTEATTSDLVKLYEETEKLAQKKTISKKRNLNTEMKTVAINEDVKNEDIEIASEEDENPLSENDDSVEGRILNSKSHIYAHDELNPIIAFPTPNIVRDNRKIKFHSSGNQIATVQFPDKDFKKDIFLFKNHENENRIFNLKFPPNANRDVLIFPGNLVHGLRTTKNINFNNVDSNLVSFPNVASQNGFAHKIQMVFPNDRLGTGNFLFDTNHFDDNHRLGKILSGNRHQVQQNHDHFIFNTNDYDRNDVNRYQNSNNYPSNNRYENQNHNSNFNSQPPNNNYNSQYSINYNKPNYQQSSSSTKVDSSTSSQNIYVTNSKGVVEYYLNAAGLKVYV